MEHWGISSLSPEFPTSRLETPSAFFCSLISGEITNSKAPKKLFCFQLLFLYVPLIPESPRWLVSKARNSEALDVLTSIAQVNRLIRFITGIKRLTSLRVEVPRADLEAACQGFTKKEELQSNAKEKGFHKADAQIPQYI